MDMDQFRLEDCTVGGRPASRRVGTLTGIDVRVDLPILIERVLVSPTAPIWVLEVVRSILNRYGLQMPVERSLLLTRT